MSSIRPKLSLRLTDESATPQPAPLEVVLHAVEHQLCVRASYNRDQIILAPHIVYERHGEPYVDGVVLERGGVRPPEAKLGSFKLSGLRNLAATMEPTPILAGFSHAEPRYAEKILATVLG